MDGLISLASAALSVAADAILKPLRYAKNGVKEIFETIVKKLPDLPSAASKILKGLANTVDGLWLVGRKIKDSIIKGINAVIEFIAKHTREAYQSIRSKLIKEVKETATEAATKGVKEATEDVIEDAVEDGVQDAIEDGISDAAIKGVGEKVYINAEDLKYSGTAYHSDRSYQNSSHLIQEIIDSQPPGLDPQGSAGLWWKVEGSYKGRLGTYELLISPDKTTIWHYQFERY